MKFMRTNFFLLIPLLLLSHPFYPTQIENNQSEARTNRFTNWQESLSNFRKALMSSDKATVKSFFIFPIRDPGNDIWLVADLSFASTIDPSKIQPFTEADFDKYYSSIFSMDFRKTLEKIDISALARDTKTSTAELIVAAPATSKMNARFNKTTQTICLSLVSKSPEFGQFTIDYYFDITPTGMLRFKETKFDM